MMLCFVWMRDFSNRLLQHNSVFVRLGFFHLWKSLITFPLPKWNSRHNSRIYNEADDSEVFCLLIISFDGSFDVEPARHGQAIMLAIFYEFG